MNKLSLKRTRDWISPENNEDSSLPSSPKVSLKKVRTESYSQMNENVNPPRSHQSPFPLPAPLDEQTIQQNLAMAERETSSVRKNRQNLQNSLPSELTEHLFTYEQVKAIVNRIVSEREAQIRNEYDRILIERLQDQFRSFSKFNEDCISRQLKNSDFSYLS